MIQEQLSDRKKYISQVRRSFDEADRSTQRNITQKKEEQTEEKVPVGFFKLRLLLSFCLFACFVLIWQSGWSYKNINAESIQKKIAVSITLPESVSVWLEEVSEGIFHESP